MTPLVRGGQGRTAGDVRDYAAVIVSVCAGMGAAMIVYIAAFEGPAVREAESSVPAGPVIESLLPSRWPGASEGALGCRYLVVDQGGSSCE